MSESHFWVYISLTFIYGLVIGWAFTELYYRTKRQGKGGVLDRIQLGDTVLCQCSETIDIRGIVLYTPYAHGEAWRIRGDDGYLYYVQHFLYMVKE